MSYVFVKDCIDGRNETIKMSYVFVKDCIDGRNETV